LSIPFPVSRNSISEDIPQFSISCGFFDMSSPLTLQDLPRELRQQILFFVFEDAIVQDVKFNMQIRRWFRDSYLELPSIRKTLLHSHPKFVDAKTPLTPCIRMPRMGTLASIFSSISREIAQDVSFVLEKSLGSFEQAWQRALDQKARFGRLRIRRREYFHVSHP
jgi:hypothetical protein